jgi:hypothetical protein
VAWYSTLLACNIGLISTEVQSVVANVLQMVRNM